MVRSPAKKNWVQPSDCRQTVEGMTANSVSLILTDPPYFLDGMGADWNRSALERKRPRKGVVTSLPAGMKFDPGQGNQLQEFLQPIAAGWMRVIKPGGFALVFSQNRLAHRTALSLELAGFEIRDMLAWRYEGQAKAFTQDHFVRKRNISDKEKRRLIRKLGGRKTPQLKPQCEMIVLAQAPKDGTFVDNWDRWETGLIDTSDPLIDPDRFPGNVIQAVKPKERYGHLTPKPVDLLRHLIRIFSAPGGLVFDPFAGTGSTGVAALLEGREFAGSEIDTEMSTIANQRIAETGHQLML